MFEVVYCSYTGNTRKVAEAMAEALGVEAKDVGAAGVVPQDAFIFLGIGCYRGELPDVVKAFMKENRFRGRRIALFTTSVFNSTEERRNIEKQLEEQGVVIVRNFKCLGRFRDINHDHPTWLELKKAAWFARSVAITLFDRRADEVEMMVPAGR
jgi:flavodoxin